MQFQSFQFLAFLLAVVFVHWMLRERPSARKNFLLAASAFFYASWDWRFLALLLAMAVVNYVAGARVAATSDPVSRRRWLALAVIFSLGALAVFKYHGFFVHGFVALAAQVGWRVELPLVTLLLPLGISFFTFQSLSYVLDVYREREAPCSSFRDFALFVAFFPTVAAGPITRARLLLPQLARPPALTGEHLEDGLALIVRGFVKKLVFADVLALHWVAPAFADPSAYSPLFLLLALYAYTFQIYMDVSGYTDIARGAARMVGLDLPENFNRPYLAASVSNFWQRWHITMSSFFRDYLFFSLGGSRHGNVYLNLMVTFVVIGIWHGAGWNFVVYGVVHGAVVCIERWLRRRREQAGAPEPAAGSWRWLASVAITFHVVVLSRVLFRAEDLDQALAYLRAMLQPVGRALPLDTLGVGVLVVAALLHWFVPQAGPYSVALFKRQPAWAQALGLVAVTYLLVALSSGQAPFVYFQF